MSRLGCLLIVSFPALLNNPGKAPVTVYPSFQYGLPCARHGAKGGTETSVRRGRPKAAKRRPTSTPPPDTKSTLSRRLWGEHPRRGT